VVSNGDTGDMSLLDNNKLLITREFNKMVDEIVKLTETRAEPSPKPNKEFQTGRKLSTDTKVLVIPVSDGKLSSHFGHCEQFAFIETRDGKIVKMEMRNPPVHEPGVLPRWLHEQGADVAIVGGMGEKAQELLKEKGIEIIIGAPVDSPESLANRYISNTLTSGANVCDH